MSKRLTFEYVRECFEKEGYTLLSEEYFHSLKQRLEYICPKGHKNNITWAGWNRGRRCKDCSKNKKLRYEDIQQSFVSEGYTLLSKKNTGSHGIYEYICPEGHRHKVKWNAWKTGIRCGICSGNKKLKYDYVKQLFDDEGYTLLSTEYNGAMTRLEYICPEGHRNNILYANWQRGRRCGRCWHESKASKKELELREYVDQFDIDYIPNDRATVFNQETGYYLELDLWFPDLRKGIEFNGAYWHSQEATIKNDKIKKEFCEWKGIDLLIVEEEDWCNRRNEVERVVREFLNYR